jgi:prephenate dehydrogenase
VATDTINLTVLGLGRLGGSLGRRLTTESQVRVSGYDRDASLAIDARRAGALHKSFVNLFQAVENADMVLITGSLTEQREDLRLIAPELKAGCVAVTVGPLLAPPLAWAAELLANRPDRYLVAAHPALNPAPLYSGETGFEAARADLFERGLWALAPAPGCPPEALRLAADLARLVGAFAYFMDPAEHDSLAAATEALPALFALALLRAASASPGWPEAQRLSERSLATATAALVEADTSALRANRENVLRYLDAALAELQALRAQLAADEAAALDTALGEALEQRNSWLADRQKGDWEHLGEQRQQLPTSSDMFGRLLVGGLLSGRAEPGKKKDSDR